MAYRGRVRPSKTVASALLSAVLALAALPGLAGPRTLHPEQALDAAAYQSVIVGSWQGRSTAPGGPLDPALRSAGFVDHESTFEEPGQAATTPAKAAVTVPGSKSSSAWKDPLYSLTGTASYYSAGSTAMRLPRGTIVVICTPRTCIERTITDYGPALLDRIIDLYKPDFFLLCGCEWYVGLTEVTVRVYT